MLLKVALQQNTCLKFWAPYPPHFYCTAEYLGLKYAPPATILSNTVPNHAQVPRGKNWNNLMLFPNSNREVLSGSRIRMRTAGRGVDYIDRNFVPPPVVLNNT